MWDCSNRLQARLYAVGVLRHEFKLPWRENKKQKTN
jgi:hypothetical protein